VFLFCGPDRRTGREGSDGKNLWRKEEREETNFIIMCEMPGNCKSREYKMKFLIYINIFMIADSLLR